MDIRIGIIQSPREIELELGDDVSREQLKADVAAALSATDGVLWLTDKKGRELAIPSARIGFVEIGSEKETPRIGFSI